MPQRLRLLLKKRGTRRTGSRRLATLGEGVIDGALLVIGAAGVYWLAANVLLSTDSDAGWWAWLVIVIPIALMVYGGAALGILLWQSVASTERRAMVVQKAIDWELLGAEANAGPPSVPAVGAVTDSPGVRLTYRLPIDAASGWVSFAMAATCLAWNTLVAVFVYQVIRQHAAGEPNWLLTWLMVPFVLAGLWTLVALGQQIWMTTLLGATRLEVSDHPFYPGGEYRGFVSQTGQLRVRWFQVQLVCEEHATYQQGTDIRVATERVFCQTLFSQRKFDVVPGMAFEATFAIPVPAAAMHSFAAPHSAVAWALVVRGRAVRWPEFQRRFPVCVYPRASAASAASEPQTAVSHKSP
jgi:hypothetical protein